MTVTIWDLKTGDRFKLRDGTVCKVIVPTSDGKGLVAMYIYDDRLGQEDFVFEHEISLSQIR